MTVLVRSGCLHGVEGVCVRVEVDILSLLPTFTVVGLAQSSVKEARERVRSAVKASDMEFPKRRLTANLAPADVPKHGTGLDLPIALAVLGADWLEKRKRHAWETPPVAIGELGLDGRLRAVRGVLPIAESLAQEGTDRLIVPTDNAAEAALVPGLDVVGVDTLRQAWEAARGSNDRLGVGTIGAPATPPVEPDLADVRGLTGGRRILEVAAAGGHGALLEGPPGSGKSMLAKRLASLLPDLDPAHALEVTRVRSAAGLVRPDDGLIVRPPLRAPHHTASPAAMIGGGNPLRPGEVTLAHRGVLFLDEVPEFPRGLLESLRQPLEDGIVTVARAREVVRFPADFQLIATRNPCPCGHLGSLTVECRCPPGTREGYERRISGPLLDRIDLIGWIDPVPVAALLQAASGEDSATVRQRVLDAQAMQADRSRGSIGAPIRNAASPLSACLQRFGRASRGELERSVRLTRGSSRSVQQLVRVASTLADLECEEQVAPDHVAEALLLVGGDRSPTSTRRPRAPSMERYEECRPTT